MKVFSDFHNFMKDGFLVLHSSSVVAFCWKAIQWHEDPYQLELPDPQPRQFFMGPFILRPLSSFNLKSAEPDGGRILEEEMRTGDYDSWRSPGLRKVKVANMQSH
jgi:hypothetical protein